jgi:hypothetical protein
MFVTSFTAFLALPTGGIMCAASNCGDEDWLRVLGVAFVAGVVAGSLIWLWLRIWHAKQP